MNKDEIKNVSPHVSNTMLAEVPVRIQRSRQHKQVSPNGLPIVYVGRGTRWGNPFRIVKYSDGKGMALNDEIKQVTDNWAVKLSTDLLDSLNKALKEGAISLQDY